MAFIANSSLDVAKDQVFGGVARSAPNNFVGRARVWPLSSAS